MDKDTKQLLEQRSKYGGAWAVAGAMAALQDLAGIIKVGYIVPWVNILVKLCRVANDPENSEHWQDMAGYAELVVAHLKTMQDTEEDELPF